MTSVPGFLVLNETLLVKYDAKGKVIWEARNQGGGQASGLALDDQGQAFLTGLHGYVLSFREEAAPQPIPCKWWQFWCRR